MASPACGRAVAEDAAAVIVVEGRRLVDRNSSRPSRAGRRHQNRRRPPPSPPCSRRRHSRPGPTRALPRRTGILPVTEEVVGRHIVGDEQVDLAIIVEVGRHNPQAPPLVVNEAGLSRHVDKASAIISKTWSGIEGKARGSQ